MTINNIILASHGTPGARAAEDAALDLASQNGAHLHQLFVVPDFWKGMMGDDWLNNAVSRIRFGDYVENQLVNEAADELERMAKAAEARAVAYSNDVRLGKPAACLIDAASGGAFDIAVIGQPRPKGVEGYRSRMALEPLVKALAIPLLIQPHPAR